MPFINPPKRQLPHDCFTLHMSWTRSLKCPLPFSIAFLELYPNAHCLSPLHFWNYIQMPSAFLYKFHFIPHSTLSKIILVQATALHLGIYLISGFTCPLQVLIN
jgi:hypothetical protein